LHRFGPTNGQVVLTDLRRPEPRVKLPQSVAETLRSHITLEVESIDRMYLNVYVPQLQREGGVVTFFRAHRGYPFASSALMMPMTKAFVDGIEAYAKEHHLPVVQFRKGQRKDDIAKDHLAKFQGKEGVLFIGKAQEKSSVIRTERRYHNGRPYPWLVRSTAMVNQIYFYCVDEDFGPFFLKFCTYFPYNAKLCINGHEYAKQQLSKRGIAFEALDNGVLTCQDPKQLQEICDGLSDEKIDGLLRKWLRRLPHPFTAKDRAAGYRYDISILQAEFSLTQVMDRPATGRALFEEIIRENLDIGRPSQVQLIFDRKVTRRTPGRFNTRVVTHGVIPALHVDYKSSGIKQYYKEGRALRTETTINDTRDFGIGKRLKNLPALRKIGFQANRRLLDVQRISHDCALGEDAFDQLQSPAKTEGQTVPALRFADPRVQNLLAAMLLFRLLPNGFSNRQLREQYAALRGAKPDEITSGQMTYDLRRLQKRGLIERIPKSHRYRVTNFGLRTALFFTRTYVRIIRPGLSLVVPENLATTSRLRKSFEVLESEMDRCCEAARLAA
jgi:hypothetical protein